MKFDFDHISFAGISGFGSDAERAEPGMKVRPMPDSPPLREEQGFDLSKHAEGVGAKGSDALAPTPLTNNSGTTELFDLSSRRDFGHEPISASYTEKYLDTFLTQTNGTCEIRDSITDFYSALKNSKGLLRYALTDDLTHNRSERTLAINKNTADRHGRT